MREYIDLKLNCNRRMQMRRSIKLWYRLNESSIQPYWKESSFIHVPISATFRRDPLCFYMDINVLTVYPFKIVQNRNKRIKLTDKLHFSKNRHSLMSFSLHMRLLFGFGFRWRQKWNHFLEIDMVNEKPSLAYTKTLYKFNLLWPLLHEKTP